MLRRCLLLLPLVLFLVLTLSVERVGADPPNLKESPFGDDGTLCVSRLVWQDRHTCPHYGPATADVRATTVRLPDPLPALSVTLVKPSDQDIAPFAYAQVIRTFAPVYNHPIEHAYGLPPKRWLGAGFIWVSVHGETTYEGRDYYQINAGEYVPAEALGLYDPSAFRGVALAAQPEHTFAWVLKALQPRLSPGGDLNTDAPVYYRYERVKIFAAEPFGNQTWYLIGPDQWINQVYVAKVTPSPLPPGLEGGAAWIDVNLFEQTLAAYVGDRMVYATLISSGLPGWDTPPGLFQIWFKVERGKMSGAYNQPDYYFLEDVPWALYFNQNIALHAAYWHNGFGYRHSHGCVNLAPSDAKWLFDWAGEGVWVRVQSGQDMISN